MQRIASAVTCSLLWAVLLRVCSPDAQGQDAALPSSAKLRLVGELLPVPPHQTTAWTAGQTNLSKEFVDATATLFQQGLADPRGCDYREIEVLVVGSERPRSDKVVTTHGWVIPHTGPRAQRFGVCWNGLVYPVALIGKPADVRADALIAATTAKADIEGALFGTGNNWIPNFDNLCLFHPAEERSISFDLPLPIKACLLLRLGEAELAERVWNRWTSGLRSYSSELGRFLSVEESVEPNKVILRDPYLVLANCWTLALFDQAEAAHIRRDDRLALASVKMLNSVWSSVKNEAEKRGFREHTEKENPFPPYFLIKPNRIRELLTDQRRRAEDRKQGAGPPVLSSQSRLRNVL